MCVGGGGVLCDTIFSKRDTFYKSLKRKEEKKTFESILYGKTSEYLTIEPPIRSVARDV